MSMPKFPDSNSLSREDAINQIISSVAMEELSLSHILNTEGEKLQYALGTLEGVTGPTEPITIEELLKVNDSVTKTLDGAVQNQFFHRDKLKSALSASTMQGPTGPTGPPGSANGLNAFGGLYDNSERVTVLQVDEPLVVPMSSTTGQRAVYYDGNSITVEEAGNYYIVYSVNATFTAPIVSYIFAVRSNGTYIIPTISKAEVNTTLESYVIRYVGNAIAEIPAGAVIDVTITSTAAQTITFGDIITLNLFKLD